MAEKEIEIKVSNLSVGFHLHGQESHVIRNVSMDIYKGETFAIVGESGSGKSVFTKTFTGMLEQNGFISNGSIIFEGRDLAKIRTNKEWISIRGRKIATIFQDPMTSLNPLLRIGYQLSETLKLHGNQLQKMHDELVSKELVALRLAEEDYYQELKAIAQEQQNAIKNLKKENPGIKNNDSKIKEIKLVAKQKCNEAKEKLNKVRPQLKADYKASNKAATEKVREFKNNVLAEMRKEMSEAKANGASRKELIDIKEKHKRRLKVTNRQAKAEAIELLRKVKIPNPEQRYRDFPFQYSGGMRQRVVIAIALACKPKVLICDEPTTALDVTVQTQILQLIKDLKKEYEFTTIFITHDLGVVASVSDRVAVMYGGQIIEYGTVEDIFYQPAHPYTWALLSSLPQLANDGDELIYIKGNPPSFGKEIVGDAFAPRSDYAMKIDFIKEPPMFKISDTHYAKTWLLDPRAPKVKKPKLIRNMEEKIHNTMNSMQQKVGEADATRK